MEEIKKEEIKKPENINENNETKNSNKKIALKKILTFIICLVVIGSRADVDSSEIKISGSLAKARAIATR